ncbi:glycosyltransferase family 1 protein [Ktedonosporobacter rubrisoli]|uniref:Glycosyltransferase family 1 protein n=1 Tax=Ktedonosporobacter rubrisoli TaxID=2509675 RepID=A0A4P6JSF4_KTERU|nr:glycosyltransferase [Ktedonosporobacter rubrisoli]QBD78468.1 glycosyltransferase family 1 protein [Ktedonosporobacter rubrisoli]
MSDMPYRVAMLSVHTSPLDSPGRTKDAGGMNVYMRELANALSYYDVNVDIFTRWTDERQPKIIRLTPNVRVIHIQAGPFSPIHKNDIYPYLPAFVSNIEEFRCGDSVSYDVIHSHYWLSGVAGVQLAQHWDIPHITTFHTLAHLKQLANPQVAEPALRLEKERWLVQQVDGIGAATEQERTQLIRYYGATAQQVMVIPCGVDLKLFTPRDRLQARTHLDLPLDGPLLLFAGRLDPFKGPDVLLRAAAMMEEKAQLAIVGGKLTDDNDLQALRMLAKELGIEKRVHFMGARPQQELPWFYSAANITVVPSYHEIFGMVAVESLACGTPVVATRAGGLTTVVKHGKSGFLVPRCPGFFAERLDALLQAEELYARLSSQARASVLQFSWANVASRVYDAYVDLVHESERLLAR